MDFNIGDWIVKALELIQQHKSLRNLYYWTLGVLALYPISKFIEAITKFISTLLGQ